LNNGTMSRWIDVRIVRMSALSVSDPLSISSMTAPAMLSIHPLQ
jgi:hypothetical protein